MSMTIGNDRQLPGQTDQGVRRRQAGQGVLGNRTVCAVEARRPRGGRVAAVPWRFALQAFRVPVRGPEGSVQHSYQRSMSDLFTMGGRIVRSSTWWGARRTL